MGRAVPPDRSRGVDEQSFLAANKVGEMGSDRLLTRELEAAKSPAAKASPQKALCLGVVLAQVPSSARFVEA